MFIRKKKNKSGTVSVQVIDKSEGYKVLKTIGSSSNGDEISQLIRKAQRFIYTNQGKQAVFSFETRTNQSIKQFLQQLSNGQIRVVGPELILGTLFDRIGFNVIKEELFRHIVVARLAYPVSKLKTVDYLYRYQGVNVDIDKIYRFLDVLNDRYKATVEHLAFEYSKNILGSIAVVFYDMTTLYFEAEDEDDLRKIGFSKDGKFQNPQIMLGLLVGENGYPIGYDIFEGNTFEGHTLLPVIEKMCQKYGFGKPIVVADAALLSKDNIKQLIAEGYQFIIGARIKNESDTIKRQILTKAKNAADQEGFDITRSDGTRLIVTYSKQRYKKDAHNRERGLVKLRQRIKSGRLKKDSINNRSRWRNDNISSTSKKALNALIVYDKFHVVQRLNTTVDTVRKLELRKARKEERSDLIEMMDCKQRFILFKKKTNLTENQKGRLDRLCSLNEPIYKAMILKEEFLAIYTKADEASAEEALNAWFTEVAASGIQAFVVLADKFKNKARYILNWFKKRISSAISEGINNKIKRLKRMAYGYRDVRYFLLKIHQHCGLLSPRYSP